MMSWPVLNEFWCTAGLARKALREIFGCSSQTLHAQAVQDQGCVQIYSFVNCVVLDAY